MKRHSLRTLRSQQSLDAKNGEADYKKNEINDRPQLLEAAEIFVCCWQHVALEKSKVIRTYQSAQVILKCEFYRKGASRPNPLPEGERG